MMRWIKKAGIVFIAVTALLVPACAPDLPSTENADAKVSEASTSPDITNTLIGTWDVALYFSPDNPPSATVMEISAASTDGALKGSFYQSPFELGRYVIKDGEVIISVVTSDGSGRYQTSGRLLPSGEFKGQTHSIGRDFLMPWTATRR
ncbi:MAG: hypothetical protein ABJN22_08395 [Litorimonas sp.]